MSDSEDPHPLEYRLVPKERQRYVEDSEERKWRYFRAFFRIVLVSLVFLFVWRFADDYFITGRLIAVQPADFVPFVQEQGVPIVQAFKRYERDNGFVWKAENTLGLEESGYLPRDKFPYARIIYPGNRLAMVYLGHYVYYVFTPDAEKWEVSGWIANGIIPSPPV
ncbi:MAG TPA: hypothetical protein VHY37_09630, partial [Tepidisphaeraceae bacterium]|nr:hypothetical protein [Tepidisphaeraceae bacterium]